MGRVIPIASDLLLLRPRMRAGLRAPILGASLVVRVGVGLAGGGRRGEGRCRGFVRRGVGCRMVLVGVVVGRSLRRVGLGRDCPVGGGCSPGSRTLWVVRRRERVGWRRRGERRERRWKEREEGGFIRGGGEVEWGVDVGASVLLVTVD